MIKLEDIRVGSLLSGLVPGEVAKVMYVEPMGEGAVTVGFKVPGRPPQEQLL